jgi:hypothetical protein
MTNQPTESRFVLRQGAWPGQWMIWDRKTRGPARLERGFATGLSEEEARQILKKLRLANGEQWPLPPRGGRAGASFSKRR